MKKNEEGIIFVRAKLSSEIIRPDFPFKKNYDEVLMKRIIRDAVDKGHKFISVTPGEAQALRYVRGKTRTCGLRLRRTLLFQLSYANIQPQQDSNLYCPALEAGASTSWATGALQVD